MNSTTNNNDDMNFQELVAGYEQQEPDQDFKKSLEKEVLLLSPGKQKSRRSMSSLLGIAAILVCALIPLGLLTKELLKAIPSKNGIALVFTITDHRFKTLSLSELLESSDFTVSGEIALGDHGYSLITDQVRSKLGNLETGQEGDLEICCKEPMQGWVFLFTKKGKVPNRHWMARFSGKTEYDAFLQRVEKYRDGSIATLLGESLLSCQGPFSSTDLLIRDLYRYRNVKATPILRRYLEEALKSNPLEPSKLVPLIEKLGSLQDKASALTILAFLEKDASPSIHGAATVALTQFLQAHLRCFASISPRVSETMVRYSQSIISQLKEKFRAGN